MHIKKTSLSLLVAIAISLISTGCEKSDESNNKDISITGNFNNTVDTTVQKASTFNTKNIAKVVVITPSLSDVFDVKNGGFEIEVSSDEPCVLIFTDSTGVKKGHLTLENGLDSLPLTLIKDGKSKIELGNLKTDSSNFTPTQNLIQNGTFKITVEQKNILSKMDDFLAAMITNSDMNKNNIVDAVEGTDIIAIYPMYQFNSGKINTDWTLDNSHLLSGHILQILRIVVNMNKVPNNEITLTTPDSTTMVSTFYQQNNHDQSFDFFDVNITGGDYTFIIDDKTYFYTLPDQSNYKSNFYIPDITLIKSGTTITKASWKFKDYQGVDITDSISLLIKDSRLGNDREEGSMAPTAEMPTEASGSINTTKIRDSLNFGYKNIYGTHFQAGYQYNSNN